MLTIGLTGGIACGKSLIARELYRLGARIIDADQLARDVVEPGKPAFHDIVATFGDEVLDQEGKIDRGRLGSMVFGDDEMREKLAHITHPRIFEEQAMRLQEMHREDPKGIVVLEVALLIESGAYRMMDYTMVAYCSPELQLQRLMERDELPREAAQLRLQAQWPLIRKVPHADFLIDTTGDVDWTIRQIDHLYPQLVGLAEDEEEE